MAARVYRLDEVTAPLTATWHTLSDWCSQLTSDQLATESCLEGRTVADLVASLGNDPTTLLGSEGTHLSEHAVTRLIDLAVLADDLRRSLPQQPAPDIPREALRIVVRTLLDQLEVKAPGRTVEVRVPPFAAVQCIEGPRHTRGTPSNTIETDPVTWIRLASGRVSWDEALAGHHVVVSGQRADLSGYLPLP